MEESVTSVASVTSPRNESVEPIEESVNSVTSPRNERVEQARQIIQNDVVQGSSSEDPSTPTTSMSLEERVERAKKLLAEKQAQKSKETQDVSKNTTKAAKWPRNIRKGFIELLTFVFEL